jgi:hypothetical protein
MSLGDFEQHPARSKTVASGFQTAKVSNSQVSNFVVMTGQSRPKDGVASTRLCPRHPRFCRRRAAKDVDVRIKPGHDNRVCVARLVCKNTLAFP